MSTSSGGKGVNAKENSKRVELIEKKKEEMEGE